MALFVSMTLGVAGGTASLLPIAIRWLDRRAVVDTPNRRSSHSQPTPRGGGLAIVLPFVLGWLLLAELSDLEKFGLATALAGFAGLGFMDDLGGLGVRLRLGSQIALGFVLAASIISTLPLVIVSAVFVVATVNAFNFMDGINGISGVTLSLAGSVYALQAIYLESANLLVVAAGALGSGVGFLPFNIPVARVFLGDVGSYFSGALLASCAILSVDSGAHMVAAAAPLAIYAADTFFTLTRRIARGDDWSVPHREHVYQQLVDRLDSHVLTSLLVGLATATSGLMGLLAIRGSSTAVAIAGTMIVATAGIYLWLPRLWNVR